MKGDQLRRLLIIHTILSRGQAGNCAELAEFLEVSRRTVYRDIEYLRDALRVPITYCPIHRSYRFTEPHSFSDCVSQMIPNIRRSA